MAGRSLPVLIADPSVLNLRFLRETMSGFLVSHIDTSSDAKYAFELALKKKYGLFLFNLSMPDLPGALLYDLLRRVDEHAQRGKRLPPVLFIVDDKSINQGEIANLVREPGVRGVLRAPIKIQRLLEQVTDCVDSRYLKTSVMGPRVLRAAGRAA